MIEKDVRMMGSVTLYRDPEDSLSFHTSLGGYSRLHDYEDTLQMEEESIVLSIYKCAVKGTKRHKRKYPRATRGITMPKCHYIKGSQHVFLREDLTEGRNYIFIKIEEIKQEN